MFSKRRILVYASSLLFFLNIGCEQTGFEAQGFSSSSLGQGGLSSNPEPIVGICSELDFKNVKWPESLSDIEIEAMAIALSITGSFEGRSGWSNLTNNFDGQGLSFGLLNQTLGTGSLQPLLIEFARDHAAIGQKIFSADNWKSLTAMLDTWAGVGPSSVQVQSKTDPELTVGEPLRQFVGFAEGQDKFYSTAMTTKASSASSDSVKWAVDTLYVNKDGRTFKSDWKNSFKELGSTPEYISLQIKAALRLHNRAFGYYERLNFTQLRGYLFLFDIVVQNGSLRTSHFNQYEQYKIDNPDETEKDDMLALMEIRVASSLPRWQPDVRSRKSAIINNSGKVHGVNRDFQMEYCYTGADKLSR